MLCFVMQMLYVCVHPAAVLNAVFCMICSLLMLAEDTRGDHMEEAHNCFVGSHECLLLFTPSCNAVSAFMIWRGLCVK